MLQWELPHNLYHIVVISRHFPTWAWVHLQLPLQELQVPPSVTLGATIERTLLVEVVVGVDRPVVDINVAIHSLCPRLRRLQKLPSRNAQPQGFNSRSQEPLELRPLRIPRAQLQRTDKLKARETMCQLAPVCAAEAADMAEVRAWLLVQMVEVAQCVAVDPSSFLQCQLPQKLEVADQVLISREEAVPLDTIETRPATLKEIGETSLPKLNNKISKVPWAISKASKVVSSQDIAIAVP